MFVDACAIVSIMTDEATAAAYGDTLQDALAPFTSSIAAWEAVMILARPEKLAIRPGLAARAVIHWLDERGVELREPSSAHDVLLFAVDVAERHGLSRRALSNFDCFHYAHAKAAGAPMLTLDRLLMRTDVPTLP